MTTPLNEQDAGLDLVSLYLYVACHPGAESALKEELRIKHPELRFSFSRPGFVTFKQIEIPRVRPRDPSARASAQPKIAVASGPIQPRGAKVTIRSPDADAKSESSAAAPKRVEIPIGLDFTLNSVFARQYGLSLDRIKTSADAVSEELPTLLARWSEENEIRPTRVHLWYREGYREGGARALTDAEALRRACAERLGLSGAAVDEAAEPGDVVLDLIGVETPDSGKSGYEFWIGLHVHEIDGARARRFPYSGGDSRLIVPEGAPSRAWYKCEEAIRFSRAPLEKGQVAVEIGSAPGGASFALLERGLQVIGVDPGEMDSRVMARREFKHFQMPASHVSEAELPERVDWLFLDMNSEPDLSIGQAEKIYKMRAETIRGLIFTLKLNQWSMVAEMSDWIERISGLAALLTGGKFTKVVAAHLPHNAQEFCVVALRDGVARRTRV